VKHRNKQYLLSRVVCLVFAVFFAIYSFAEQSILILILGLSGTMSLVIIIQGFYLQIKPESEWSKWDKKTSKESNGVFLIITSTRSFSVELYRGRNCTKNKNKRLPQFLESKDISRGKQNALS